MIPHSKVLELIHYNPETGIFTWLKGHRKGLRAGCYDGRYIQIQLGGVRFLSGRLAWYYMTGMVPKDQIDHKDNDTINDKWENLREATHQQNQCNRRVQELSTSQIKGVRRLGDKFYVAIGVKGEKLQLGGYNTLEEAQAAYIEAAKKYHGEFAKW